MQVIGTSRKCFAAAGNAVARLLFSPKRLFVFGTIFIFSIAVTRGQEALRLSLAGEAAAQSEKQSAESIGYYNILAGPTAWRFSSALATEYDDNIRLRESHGQNDFIFRPQGTAQMHWPVTEHNSLDFSLGAGYSFYTQHSDLNRFSINPGSGTAFNIYAGDFVIRLRDSVSIQNNYQNAGTTGNQSRLENVSGGDVTWDLNKAQATFSYEHGNYIGLDSGQQQPDGDSDNVLATFGVRLVPEMLLGVELGGGIVNYQQMTNTSAPGAKQWNAGGLFSAQLTQYISARLDAGYTIFLPDISSTNFASTQSGFYFQASISHAVNEHFNYALTAGRTTDFQFYGQPYTHYFVRLQPNWNVVNGFTVSTPFSWEKGEQIYNRTVTFDQFIGEISVGRQIAKKLSGSFYYRFIKQISSAADFNYTVNIVGLNFSYQF